MPCCHPFCASLSGLSHAPLPQLLRGSPETRAHCVEEAHRGLGAGWSVCVNILQSLRKPPTLATLAPQVLQSFVCARGKMGTSRMPAWA